MGQLRTSNKRHKGAIAKTHAPKAAVPVPAKVDKAAKADQ